MECNVVEGFTVLTILSLSLSLTFSPLVHVLPLPYPGRNLSLTSPGRKAVIGLFVLITIYPNILTVHISLTCWM